MKANELRIGNLVSDGFFMYKVAEIHNGIVKGFSTQNGKNVYPDTLYSLNEENLQGIPLTEGWLRNSGFPLCTLTEQGKFYSVNEMILLFSHVRQRFFLQDIEVENVHQLQNLYFTLTKKELI